MNPILEATLVALFNVTLLACALGLAVLIDAFLEKRQLAREQEEDNAFNSGGQQ